MKQVSKKEKEFIEELKLVPLLLYVCSDDISQFKWSHINLKWELSKRGNFKEVLLRDKGNIFVFDAKENLSYIHIMVPANQKKFIPEKELVTNLLKNFELQNSIVWVNEWLFDKDYKFEIGELITIWTKNKIHIAIIKNRLLKLNLNSSEVENILASHPLYENTDLLVATYPHRLNFLDKSKLNKFYINEE